MFKFKSTAFACIMVLAGSPIAAADAVADFPVEAASAAMATGDIPAAVGYLMDDAVFTALPTPGRWEKTSLVGKDEIGGWWEFLAADNSTLSVKDLKLDGDRATFVGVFHGDHFRSKGIGPVELDGVAILRGGKIQALVFAGRP